MNPPDLIANKILEFLRPDSYDGEEEKKLKERDEIKSGKIMMIDYFALFGIEKQKEE